MIIDGHVDETARLGIFVTKSYGKSPLARISDDVPGFAKKATRTVLVLHALVV